MHGYICRTSTDSGRMGCKEEKLLRKRQAMVTAMLTLALLTMATRPANAQFTYTVVHTFTGSPDGVYPSLDQASSRSRRKAEYNATGCGTTLPHTVASTLYTPGRGCTV